MPDERRRAPRARIPETRIKYESASGERLSAFVLDICSGGLFIHTEKPIPVGKRLSLEIEIPGESTAWAALGRVLWTRDVGHGDQRPPGMGIAFIDVDDMVLASIDRLVLASGTKDRGREGLRPGAPARERTMLGVGLTAHDPAPTAPILAVAPAREKTELGIAPGPVATGSPAPEKVPAPILDERSVAIDLVAKKPRSVPPAPAMAEEDSSAGVDSVSPAGVPKKGRTGCLFLLVFLLSAAAAGYTYRARLRPWIAPYAQMLAHAIHRPAPDSNP